MNSTQFRDLTNEHAEVISEEYRTLDNFMALITEDLMKDDLPKEQRELYDSVFNTIYEARENLLIAVNKIKIVKEITKNE